VPNITGCFSDNVVRVVAAAHVTCLNGGGRGVVCNMVHCVTFFIFFLFFYFLF